MEAVLGVVSCAKLPVSQHYYIAFGDKMIAESNMKHLRNMEFRRRGFSRCQHTPSNKLKASLS
jgi:hypothetical protein